MGAIIMWRHPWTEYISNALVLENNPGGTITKLDLELNSLIIHKTKLITAIPKVVAVVPHSGSENTPTISWSMQYILTIKLVIAKLLNVHML